MADSRLSISEEIYSDFVLPYLDEKDVLNMNSDGERADLFMVALALGVKAGVRTPIKKSRGFIQNSALETKPNYLSYIRAVAISELRKTKEENLVANTDIVYKIAEEYANTGFEELKKMLPKIERYDSETFVLKLIEGLQDEYQTLKP